MEFAGHESEAELLGLFQVSILHNVVHVAFGIAGVVASRHWNSARGYLIGGGVVYLLLWVYGLVTDLDSDANFVPLNTADNWLHFVLGSGMIALGLLLARAEPVGGTARIVQPPSADCLGKPPLARASRSLTPHNYQLENT